MLKPIPLYIQFFENRIKITRLDTEEVVEQIAPQPFTSVRLLLGDFENGEKCLQLAIKQLNLSKWLAPQMNAVAQAMSMTEGGLSKVEIRAFKELTERCGARKVYVYENDEPLRVLKAINLLKDLK